MRLEWRTLVTGDRLDDIIGCSWQGLIFFFDFRSRPTLGPTQLPVTCIQTSLPLREGSEEEGMEIITDCPSNSKHWSASIYTSNSSKRLPDVFLTPGKLCMLPIALRNGDSPFPHRTLLLCVMPNDELPLRHSCSGLLSRNEPFRRADWSISVSRHDE